MKTAKACIGAMVMTCGLSAHAGAAQKFFLKNGDHVCFYGDSITEQRYYAVDVETYVRTRFPNLHVRFVDSGVGCIPAGHGTRLLFHSASCLYHRQPAMRRILNVFLGHLYLGDASCTPGPG